MKIEDKNKILDFYINFNKLRDLSSIAYINNTSSDKSRGLRQIKAQDLSVNSEGINIDIDSNTVSFIKKGVSPIIKVKSGNEFIDTNSLHLALAFMKVEFKEEEKTVYFPLITIDITDRKELMFNTVQNKGKYNLNINFKDEKISFCEEVLDYFFDFNYESNNKTEKEHLTDSLDEFIPIEKRNLNNMIEYIYDFFRKGKYDQTLFDIKFPAVNSNNSSIFMFFNIQNNYKLNKELEEIKEEDNLLLDEYFSHEEPINKKNESTHDYWAGSLTKDYPLGKGQGIVLQRNQLNDRIIPVIGGPGTGKSTLFLSLISNEVTKRALSNIFENKDYSNLMLITSTANKAIENVYSSLKKGFKHGFCLVGGSNDNKESSKKEVEEFIEIIKGSTFNEKNKLKYESNIRRMLAFYELRKENFLEINKYKSELLKLKIKKFENLSWFLKNLDEDLNKINVVEVKAEIAFINSTMKQFKLILGLDDITSTVLFFDNIEEDLLPKLEIIKNKINSLGFIGKIFKNKEKIINEYFNIKEDDFKVLYDLAHLLISKKEKLKDIKSYQEIIKVKPVLEYYFEKYKNNTALFNNYIQFDSFGEYFRLNLYSSNYKFYLMCYNYLYQKMLENKSDVLKALNYIVADNQYKYYSENYRFNKESYDKFLINLSLAYPVTTSTLAAISNNLKEIYPGKSTTYNTVLADEAGMICVNDIIPILRRSNRAIIVGDPKQLPPIISLSDIFVSKLKNNTEELLWNKFSPTSLSAFHRSAGTLTGGYLVSGRGIMLDEHRRCSPKIANLFIKIGKYEGLNVKTRVSTRKSFKNIKEELMFFNIKNNSDTIKNVNLNEIDIINVLLNKLERAGYNLQKEIGIITPYKKQEAELIKAFGHRLSHNRESSKIGTVHKFQGAEFKVILFSSVASNKLDSLSFINNDPSLTIVSISRAIESLIVIGDYDKLTEDKSDENFIGEMAKEIKNLGLYIDLQKK